MFLSSRSASCCRRCGGGWGWTSRWTRTCLSAPGPHWWVGPTRSSRTSSTTRSQFLQTPSAGQTPTTPRCWCGGPGEERHSWSYRQNRKAKCLYTATVSGSLRARRGGSLVEGSTEPAGKMTSDDIPACTMLLTSETWMNRLVGGYLVPVSLTWIFPKARMEPAVNSCQGPCLYCGLFFACFLLKRDFFLWSVEAECEAAEVLDH